jgi:rare lipoprotein A
MASATGEFKPSMHRAGHFDLLGNAILGNDQGPAVVAYLPGLASNVFVEITSLETGRVAIALAQPSGGLPAKSVAALSPAAFAQLGLTDRNSAKVRLRRVLPSPQDSAQLESGRPASDRIGAPAGLLSVLNERYAKGDRVLVPMTATTVPVAPDYGRPTAVVTPPVVTPPVETRALPTDMADMPPGVTWGNPAPAPVASRPVKPVPAPGPVAASGLYVQVGAFSDPVRADALARRLTDTGPVRVDPVGSVTRVRVGPFASQAEADVALARVRAKGYGDARVLRGN